MDLNMLQLTLRVKLSPISIILCKFSTNIIPKHSCKQWSQFRNSLIFVRLISLEKDLKTKTVWVKAWFLAKCTLRMMVGKNKNLGQLIHHNQYQEMQFN